MNTELGLIVLITAVACLFWQQRKQSEHAQRYIQQRCEQLGLQLLSIRRGRYHWRSPAGKTGWFTRYYFEFSANGSDYYQGSCWLQGVHLVRFDIPPHHLPDADY
ncbi:DUF3301 domain-containing protein [Thaumasiovibrio sp. DFM-14]|uniref:DUF3301 domain-containing protein n=1 Tax=Thaumasiovibrio sp. DFM-14 TaxID=3384792 RepID=UPI0039A1AA79